MKVRIAAVVSEGDTILLVQHRRRGLSYWTLPGGRLEADETIEECLCREMMEETGFEVEPRRLLFVTDVFAPNTATGDHDVNLVFHAEIVGGLLRPGHGGNMDEAHDQVAFVPLSALAGCDLRPPLAEHIVCAAKEGFHGETQCLGNLWRKETPAAGRQRATA